MAPVMEPERTLPPPWDRIFSLASRTFVWGILLGVLYVLRPFLLLVFLTFVFAYVQAHGVDGLAHRIKSRTARVWIVGMVFLGTLAATGFTLFPQVKEQALTFWQNRDTYAAAADKEVNLFLRKFPAVYDSLLKRSAALRDLGDEPAPTAPTPTEGTPPPDAVPTPPGTVPVPQAAEPAANGELHVIRDLLGNVQAQVAGNAIEFGRSVLGYASYFLLSLLFSFLIVLDLPKLQRGVQGLTRTKIGFIYDEVADNIAGFGLVLGRALEAQLFIAVVNTILTAIGIWAMDIPNLLVLSTIVFFCSFIPVAGTFLSSTPICLLALQGDGVGAMVFVIVLIGAIHGLETYVLNPMIYGHHMHMNPVLVLIILTVCGTLFGVWGLLLGIPVMNYLFRHAIRYPVDAPATG
jgi:predicted PurR-regulated permease PerM